MTRAEADIEARRRFGAEGGVRTIPSKPRNQYEVGIWRKKLRGEGVMFDALGSGGSWEEAFLRARKPQPDGGGT